MSKKRIMKHNYEERLFERREGPGGGRILFFFFKSFKEFFSCVPIIKVKLIGKYE